MSEGQGVQLQELLFTLSWEDPALDRAAFGNQPGRRIATVASGGCNALTFLLDDPELVFAFDYNPSQVWTTELKRAAFSSLDHSGVLELLGVRASERRSELFAEAAAALSPGAKHFWEQQPWLLENGILGGGRYERFVGLFRRLLRIIQGRRKIEALFEERDREQRIRFFDHRWDTWAWRLLFRTFFNKRVLARRGLSPEYFTFDDGSASFAESFYRRSRRVMTELPVRDNYFLAQYTKGAYLDERHLPEYLLAENFDTMRERIGRLEVELGDVRDVFDRFEPASFHGICLSNIFELMSEQETEEVLKRIAPALASGGRMTLRNLMVPRKVPSGLTDMLVLDEEGSRTLHERDRSFVYRSFQVYTRSPSLPPTPGASRTVAEA